MERDKKAKITPQTLLSVEQIEQRYGLTRRQLKRWMLLRRIRPLREPAKGQLRFAAGDIVRAIEYSAEEPGSKSD